MTVAVGEARRPACRQAAIESLCGSETPRRVRRIALRTFSRWPEGPRPIMAGRATGDSWRPWRKARPEFLARYVNVDAVESSLSDLLVRTSDGSSFHDIRNQGTLENVVGAL